MGFYLKLLDIIGQYYINGLFMSVVVIIAAKRLLSNYIETKISISILKWSVISYCSFGVISFLANIMFNHNSGISAFSERATGPYWWAYWIMVLSHLVAPLTLIIKKLGERIYFVLFISLVMNLGWIFESFVVHMTSLHRDYLPATNTISMENWLPYSREWKTIWWGILFGGFLLILGNFVSKFRSN
jgi:hypothetical protein